MPHALFVFHLVVVATLDILNGLNSCFEHNDLLPADNDYIMSSNLTNMKNPCKPDTNGDLKFIGNIQPFNDKHFNFDMDNCTIRRPKPSDYRRCFTDKTIVLMGDSTTNFQYFSLVAYMRYGKFGKRIGSILQIGLCITRLWRKN